MGETREFLTIAYYIEMQILTSFRNAASCFLSLAPCTNAETCTSCVTQLDRFQERQRISWKFVDVPLHRRSINEWCFTIRQNLLVIVTVHRESFVVTSTKQIRWIAEMRKKIAYLHAFPYLKDTCMGARYFLYIYIYRNIYQYLFTSDTAMWISNINSTLYRGKSWHCEQ